MKKLYLIDANSLIHRAFHAIPPLTGPGGEPTGALYGLANILWKLWSEEKPDYAAALFDRPEPTFRKEEYKEYKAHRPETADELVDQIIEAHRLFPAFGIKTFEAAGFEADDLIATLAEKFKNEKDLEVIIFTGDLDTLQMVGGNIFVRTPQKGLSETTTYNREAVVARYGLPPEKLTDYKAFVGDNSDNVKGVPGIGPKTAADLIQKYGSVEGVFAAAEKDDGLKKKLSGFRDQAAQAKRLVTLRLDAPTGADNLEELSFDANEDSIAAYAAEKGFTALLRRLRGETPEKKPKKKKTKNGAEQQAAMF